MSPMLQNERLLIVALAIGLIVIVAASALAQGFDRTFFPHP